MENNTVEEDFLARRTRRSGAIDLTSEDKFGKIDQINEEYAKQQMNPDPKVKSDKAKVVRFADYSKQTSR